MNRILLTGTALLTLLNAAVPASAAQKYATQYQQAPIQQRSFGSGALVDEVDANSPAARAGMRPGDRIVAINGRPIDGISDVNPFVEGGGRPITLDIERGGRLVRVRASPPNGGWHVGALGITGTYYPFCPGGNYCASSDDAPPPYIPDPPIPTPPPDYTPPPIQNN
jgi:membrane-associated protease RseP (regulator of RpoE activity)